LAQNIAQIIITLINENFFVHAGRTLDWIWN